MKLLREPVKDSTKGETQLIANPSYPRSALSLHFAMYAGRPPLKDSISRGLAGIFTPKYQESARGKRETASTKNGHVPDAVWRPTIRCHKSRPRCLGLHSHHRGAAAHPGPLIRRAFLDML